MDRVSHGTLPIDISGSGYNNNSNDNVKVFRHLLGPGGRLSRRDPQPRVLVHLPFRGPITILSPLPPSHES